MSGWQIFVVFAILFCHSGYFFCCPGTMHPAIESQYSSLVFRHLAGEDPVFSLNVLMKWLGDWKPALAETSATVNSGFPARIRFAQSIRRPVIRPNRSISRFSRPFPHARREGRMPDAFPVLFRAMSLLQRISRFPWRSPPARRTAGNSDNSRKDKCRRARMKGPIQISICPKLWFL